MQAVETVEKVPFQKSVFEKWERNIENAWFLVFRTAFRQHFGNF